ncbi:MAG TPA: hypothetical protein VKZ58_11175, partial [Longimicrobiales bacterium]|nr:hypothetical protein [Longimicrobiales bacterium]
LRAHPRVIRLTWDDGYAAIRTPPDLPVSRAVAATAEQVLGTSVLRVPLLIVPMVNHDNNQHAPNENLRIRNLWDGILLYAGLTARLGVEWEGVGT